MKPFWSLILFFGVAFAQTARSPLEEVRKKQETPEPLPDGAALMASVQRNLPEMPLRLTGEIQTRTRKEKSARALQSDLRFGQSPAWVSFVISDAFGSILERLRISWLSEQPVWTREGIEIEEPENIARTGLRGEDLALSFLWWPGAKVTGIERIRARNAYIVEVPHPSEPGMARLWVDQRALFVVEAEFLDEEGEPLRRLEVDRLKKIRDDLWMVQDLVIRDFAARRTIKVRFETVEELE